MSKRSASQTLFNGLIGLVFAVAAAAACEAVPDGPPELTQQGVADISGGKDLDCNHDTYVDSECEKCTAEGFLLRVCIEEDLFPSGGGGGGPPGGGGTPGGGGGGTQPPPEPRAPGECGKSEGCIRLYEEAKQVSLGPPWGRLFWSGEGMQDSAEFWGRWSGAATQEMALESTLRGQLLMQSLQSGKFTWAETIEVWRLLARRWASDARGDVYVFLRFPKRDGVWATVERPILEELERRGLVRLHFPEPF